MARGQGEQARKPVLRVVAGRAVGSVGEADGASAGGGVIDGEKATGEGFADAGDEFDGFHGAKAGGGA